MVIGNPSLSKVGQEKKPTEISHTVTELLFKAVRGGPPAADAMPEALWLYMAPALRIAAG